MVIMGCDSSHWQGPHPIPENIIFNAPRLHFPDQLSYLREAAISQGLFLNAPGEAWYCSVSDTTANFYHYPEGTMVDTNIAPVLNVSLSPLAVIFVDGKLDIRGVLANHGCKVFIGSSEDIRLVDNVMLEGTNSVNGALPADATSSIVLASERSIYIGNTWENGRENRTGPPPNNRDIVITAFVFAMRGQFQIEQMNDVNDPYISPTQPDERGNIVLTGGITEWHRGYVHRSNRGGTGYNKVYHYDQRLRYRRFGVFEPFLQPDDDDIFSDASEPLFPAQFTLAVSPNPFNASTTIRFTLPQASNVRAVVYDVLGREVAVLADRQFAEGSHTTQVDGSAWSSGLYFLSFQSREHLSTHKLMLLK